MTIFSEVTEEETRTNMMLIQHSGLVRVNCNINYIQFIMPACASKSQPSFFAAWTEWVVIVFLWLWMLNYILCCTVTIFSCKRLVKVSSCEIWNISQLMIDIKTWRLDSVNQSWDKWTQQPSWDWTYSGQDWVPEIKAGTKLKYYQWKWSF